MTRAWSPRPGALFAEESPGDDGRRLVLLHGFTQTSRSWDRFVDAIGTGPAFVRVDAPGHGRSPMADSDLTAAARMVVDIGGDGVYVGYSMGARILLHAAVAHAPLRGLVLIGGTPGIADPVERAQRRDSDRALAARVDDLGVADFVEWWLAQPLFAGLPDDPVERTARLSNTVEGLTSSLRRHGVGEQEPLWDRLATVEVPVLVLAGAHDHKFDDIGRRMSAAIGANATFASVPDCGHAAHLERPDHVARIVRDWLD